MKDPDVFVDRPRRKPRGLDPNSRHGLLRQTAENGKAILVPRWVANGATATALHDQGYRIRTSSNGAPPGQLFAWCERIETEKKEQP